MAIENAYVKDAARAFVHRAHSGPFGLVNSEEGYQNLTRFLFGDWRCEIFLDPLEVRTSGFPGVEQEDVLQYLEINVDVVLRGLPSYLTTRRELDYSAVVVEMVPNAGQESGQERYVQKDPKRIHLFTAFLRTDKRRAGDDFMHGAVNLRIMPHFKRPQAFVRDSRFEGEAMLNNRLHVGIKPGQPPIAIYRWSHETDAQGNLVDFQAMAPVDRGCYRFPFPKSSDPYISCDCLHVVAEPLEIVLPQR